MKHRWHDGRDDGLTPLESLNLGSVNGFGDMLRQMAKTAFGARELGEAFEVFQLMAKDQDWEFWGQVLQSHISPNPLCRIRPSNHRNERSG